MISGNAWDGVHIVGSGTRATWSRATTSAPTPRVTPPWVTAAAEWPSSPGPVATLSAAPSDRPRRDLRQCLRRRLPQRLRHGSNFVEYDFIGTDATGNFDVPNGTYGVIIQSGSSDNEITYDVISGNGSDGVFVNGSGTNYNSVFYSEIGFNSAGTAAVTHPGGSYSNIVGVQISYGASGTVVDYSTISGNLLGVEIDGSTPATTASTTTDRYDDGQKPRQRRVRGPPEPDLRQRRVRQHDRLQRLLRPGVLLQHARPGLQQRLQRRRVRQRDHLRMIRHGRRSLNTGITIQAAPGSFQSPAPASFLGCDRRRRLRPQIRTFPEGLVSFTVVVRIESHPNREPLMPIYIDADACPVKEEVYRVARRYEIKVFVVANAPIRVPSEELIELVVVRGGFDAADDRIVERWWRATS